MTLARPEAALLDCEVVQNRTGASVMRDKLTGELMHPVGPLLEPTRLYVAASNLELRLQQAGAPLVLWDVGLGAGSNAAAAWRCSEALSGPRRRLRLLSFDRSLVALELALRPAHASAFGLEQGAADAAHALFEHGLHRSAHCDWELRLGELQTTLAQLDAAADIVFWDPFSPGSNPELWSYAAFLLARRGCSDGATLHTYSGATAVRSALLLAGFAVGRGECVAKGKFATCAATAPDALREPLDRRWFERLARSSAPFPADAPADALERIAALPQFAR
jgi:queuine tRNA-ribosyltransferase